VAVKLPKPSSPPIVNIGISSSFSLAYSLFCSASSKLALLLYNSESDENPIIKDNFTPNYYHKSDGIIFVTVGTAGDKLQNIEDQADYYAIQDNEEFGFLNLKLENNGKTLIGEFHTNKGDIMDHFELKHV
jgi:Iron/zinc purple acid phosphatase-like protein C